MRVWLGQEVLGVMCRVRELGRVRARSRGSTLRGCVHCWKGLAEEGRGGGGITRSKWPSW
jgi:hypothetical protein